MGRGLVMGTNRLFAAADYLLRPEGALPTRPPDDLRPGRLGEPTAVELDEARAMLVRMGFLEARSKPDLARPAARASPLASRRTPEGL